MNINPYERHLDRSLAAPEPTHEAIREPGEAESNALARHADPSIRDTQGVLNAREPGSGVAWVRPSELPTVIGSKFIRRGIDLQAELNRRARHAPRTAARVTRRVIARPITSSPTTDRGVEL